MTKKGASRVTARNAPCRIDLVETEYPKKRVVQRIDADSARGAVHDLLDG